MKVFSVFDVKAGSYMQPFFMQATGMAVRAFTDLLHDESTVFGKHPEDYTLFAIAEWDDQKGLFTSYDNHLNLGTGLEFLAEKNK